MTDAAANKARRDAIARKVRALLSKTTANGCTEEEALAAAQTADELMREHDLTFKDTQVELEADVYGARRRSYSKGARREHPISNYAATAIGEYWDCKCYQSRRHHAERHNEIVYFGSKSDTEAAHMMLAMLILAADTEFARYWNSYKRPEGIKYNTGYASFMTGMASRLAARLREIKKARNAATVTTGTALVIVKDRVVAAKFATFKRESGLNLGGAGRSSSVRSQSAFNEGRAAANRADLGGSRLNNSTRAIGGR